MWDLSKGRMEIADLNALTQVVKLKEQRVDGCGERDLLSENGGGKVPLESFR